MKTKIIILFLLALFITACGSKATPAPESATMITLTPDPCSQENLPAEIGKVNKHTREFDDYSTLASNTPNNQIITLIPDMQRIRREAEDQDIPTCLTTLKQIQIAQMNTVIQTLLAFMGQTDKNTINAGINQARNLHNQYEVEMARLLGITLPPPSTPIPATATP